MNRFGLFDAPNPAMFNQIGPPRKINHGQVESRIGIEGVNGRLLAQETLKMQGLVRSEV